MESEAGKLGKMVDEVRRTMSVEEVRTGCNTLCLLERLAFLEPAAKGACARRKVVQRLEERRDRPRNTAWQTCPLARRRSRVGRAFVP